MKEIQTNEVRMNAVCTPKVNQTAPCLVIEYTDKITVITEVQLYQARGFLFALGRPQP